MTMMTLLSAWGTATWQLARNRIDPRWVELLPVTFWFFLVFLHSTLLA